MEEQMEMIPLIHGIQKYGFLFPAKTAPHKQYKKVYDSISRAQHFQSTKIHFINPPHFS